MNNGPFEFETYAEVSKKVNNLASAIAAAGLGPQEALGVFGANSPEWMITMQVDAGGPTNFTTQPCWPLATGDGGSPAKQKGIEKGDRRARFQ